MTDMVRKVLKTHHHVFVCDSCCQAAVVSGAGLVWALAGVASPPNA
jgi:hypothetical protein